MATKPEDLMGMSDEDILNMNAPPEPANDGGAASGAGTDANNTNGGGAGDPTGSEPKVEPAAKEPASTDAKPEEGKEPDNSEPKLFTPDTGTDTAADKTDPAKSGEAAEKPENEDGPKPGEGKDPKDAGAGNDAQPGADGKDPKDAGQARVFQVPTSFKANGRTIELRSEEEALQLMQMGANYTKKLQELQPAKKLVMMLEDNGLADHDKLTYVIDLMKGDPEAIKKLVKDSGIDPMEIDTSQEPAYIPGHHGVTDQAVAFRTTLEDISSSPEGKQTLAEINGTWDQASKQAIWESPDIMSVIHTQREQGIYDVIKAEVDRQITLGTIPANTPFLQAYKTVGDAMAAEAMKGANGGGGAKAEEPSDQSGQAKEPQVLAVKAADPKLSVKSDDGASAAAAPRTTPKVAAPFVNPLAESDADFMKRMNGRL